MAGNNPKKHEIRALVKSFVCAFSGLAFCIKNERNMRIHFTVLFYIIILSLFYSLNRAEYAVLFLTFGLVIAAEAVNTSIETIVNLLSPTYNHLAKLAKDIAAASVLISGIAAVCVGFCLFFDIEKLCFIARYFICTEHLIYTILLALSVPAAIVFVFKGPAVFMKKV